MKIEKNTSKIEDKVVVLGSVEKGKVFRFSHLSFEDALSENAFYMVLEAPEKKGVFIANVFDGRCLVRDTDHRVIVHDTVVRITE